LRWQWRAYFRRLIRRFVNKIANYVHQVGYGMVGRGCTAAGAAVGAPFGALPLLPSAPILGALFLFRASSRLQLPIVAAPASCRRTACACNGPRSSHAAAAPHVASPHVASLHVASRTLHRRSALRSIIIGGRGQLRRGE
jgi:hypothetical protein